VLQKIESFGCGSDAAVGSDGLAEVVAFLELGDELRDLLLECCGRHGCGCCVVGRGWWGGVVRGCCSSVRLRQFDGVEE